MKVFLIILNIILTSLFFFPFEFKALPGLNTKMILAVIGLAILALNLIKQRSASIRSDLFRLFILAGVVSLIGLFSITYNNTSDTAYASYLVSMAVWLSAAYTVVSSTKAIHGKVNTALICRYLTAVCAIQCVLAMVIEYNPAFKALIDSVIEQEQDFLNQRNVHRLYGIGARLDIAGGRFSLVLLVIMYLLFNDTSKDAKKFETPLILAFGVIAVIGNIISRTTTVGLAVALAYMGMTLVIKHNNVSRSSKGRVLKKVGIMLAIGIPVVVFFYNTNINFHNQIQFGFEGFFSIFESGEWHTDSNEKLETMIVFPESLKTWIIGDGYFSSPRNDPNFIGEIVGGYYMGTDIGYLRFIFYFGIVGLIAFSVFLIGCCETCMKLFPEDKWLFVLILLIGFIIWLKVSTDMFLFFALFLAMDPEKEDEDEAEEADAQITEG